MVMNVGIDIEEISRFSSINYSKRKSFYQKIFTRQEIDYCLTFSNPYPHFTIRFCAKEAAIKALDEKIKFTDIEIQIDTNKPTIKLPKNKNGIVSLSHTQKYAIACVIIT